MGVRAPSLGVTFDLLPRPLHWPGGGLVSCPDPTLCKEKGLVNNLGPGKGIWASLSKSCDYLPQEFRSTNHKVGIELPALLQSECRFILQLNTQLCLQNQEKCRYSPDPFSLAEGGVWARAQSVNEVEDPGAGVQCVKLCGGGLVQEVGCVVVVGDILVCLLVLTRYYWHCL